MVEAAEKLVGGNLKYTRPTDNDQRPTVLVHCWRGGMRSAAVAWLLDLYGFTVYSLAGGYKAYRRWVKEQFEKSYPFNVVGGYTGSGKTLLLGELRNRGNSVIDLELLARHKGSAFGDIGEEKQPGQEMFENMLAQELSDQSCPQKTIWIEDESNRIGNLAIPMNLWRNMRNSPIFFLEVPFDSRLAHITSGYGRFEKEKLVNAIMRIQKRLGGLETKNAINFLLEGDMVASFSILLKYYDKWYGKALKQRENLSVLLNKIACTSVDTVANTQNLLHVTSIAEKTL